MFALRASPYEFKSSVPYVLSKIHLSWKHYGLILEVLLRFFQTARDFCLNGSQIYVNTIKGEGHIQVYDQEVEILVSTGFIITVASTKRNHNVCQQRT